MIKVAINGAVGKMGKRLVALASADADLELVAALDVRELGADAGVLAGIDALGIPVTSELPNDAVTDVMIDFSSSAAFDFVLDACLARKIALVYATTGLTDEQTARLEAAAREIPVLRSPSMSPLVNLTMKLSQIAARALKDSDADVEIMERHHRYKVDSPSGTALKFGALIGREMGIDSFRSGREGKVGARPHNEICYHAVRAGDNSGEHTILFGLLGESLELTVRSSNRDAYALGALLAAKYLASQRPGRLYDMNDALDL